MAHIGKAYIAMAYIVMAQIVMAYLVVQDLDRNPVVGPNWTASP